MTRNLREVQCGKVRRKTFSKIKEAIDIPYLVEVQKDSYDNFIKEGISEVLEDFSPITDYSDHFELYFLDHVLSGTPKYDEKECRDRDATFALPLRVNEGWEGRADDRWVCVTLAEAASLMRMGG